MAQRARGALQAWRALTPATRWLALGLLAAAALSVALAAFLNRPNLTPLGQFAPQDAGAITAKLNQLKVPYQPGADGQTIMVAQSDLFTARLAVAQAGVSHDGTTGYELFDKTQFGATELQQQVNLQRALEGELSRALMRLAPVAQAQVRLALPEQSPFIRDQKPTSAAILVSLRPGSELQSAEVSGLTRFVASSVPGLAPAAVTVIDSQGRLLSADPAADGADSATLNKQKLDLEKRMEARVLSLLEPVYGAGGVVAKVSLTLDNSKRTVDTQTLLAGPDGQGLVRSKESTQESTSNGSSPAPAGAGAVPTPPQYVGTGNTGSPTTTSTTHTITNYDYGQEHQVQVIGPGTVSRVTAGVMINAGGGLSQTEVDQIRQTVAAALGAASGDITITALPFRQQQALQDIFKEPAQVATPLPRWWPFAAGGLLALILAGGLLLRRRREPAAPGWSGLSLGEAGAAPAERHAAAAERHVAAAEGAPPATHGLGSDPAGSRNGAKGSGGQGDRPPIRLVPLPDGPPDPETPVAPDPESEEEMLLRLLGPGSKGLPDPELKDQVERLAIRHPQEAAAILRTWLTQRRR